MVNVTTAWAAGAYFVRRFRHARRTRGAAAVGRQMAKWGVPLPIALRILGIDPILGRAWVDREMTRAGSARNRASRS